MKRAAAGIAVSLAVATAGCAARTAGDGAETPAWSAIEMEMFSWGAPVFRWRIDAEGNAIYTYSRTVQSGRPRDYDLVTHRFSAGRAGFARVSSLLARAA